LIVYPGSPEDAGTMLSMLNTDKCAVNLAQGNAPCRRRPNGKRCEPCGESAQHFAARLSGYPA